MNYITSCPECDTHFILNTEHIKSHRGKVQCGSCEHVFNAKNRVTEIPDDITSAEEYQARLDNEHAENEHSDENDHENNDENNYENDEDTLIDEIIIEDDSDAAAESVSDEEADDLGELNPDTTSPDDEQEEEEEEPSDTDDTINSPSFFDDVKTEPSFTKQTATRTTWPMLFGFVLLLAAAAQAIYYMRVQIAAEYPQFKSLLVDACQQLNCAVTLPKNLDFITIGDSDMQEDENY